MPFRVFLTILGCFMYTPALPSDMPVKLIFPDFIIHNETAVYVEEGKDNGSFIASILIEDDFKSIWNLTLNTDCFSLQHSYGKTWALYTALRFDREKQVMYNFNVIALPVSNSKYERKSYRLDILIYIIDVNDNEPVFNPTVFPVFHVPVGIRKNTRIIKMNATDIDIGRNSEIFYSLDNYNDLFDIGVNDGYLFCKKSLILATRYDIIIRATDRGVPPLSTTILFKLNLVADRWSFYRMNKIPIVIGIAGLLVLLIAFLVIVLLIRRTCQKFGLNNQLKFGFLPFCNEITSSEKPWVNHVFDGPSHIDTSCFYSSTLPVVPCVHVEEMYGRAEIAHYVTKNGCCQIKCQKCEADSGKYTIRYFERNANGELAVNRSHSDDGCYCSSDISSENSDRRKAREVLTVTSVDDTPVEPQSCLTTHVPQCNEDIEKLSASFV